MTDHHFTRLDKLLDTVSRGEITDLESAVDLIISVHKEAAQIEKDQAYKFGLIKARAKELMTEIMAETKQFKFKTGSGNAYIPDPGVSVKWDSKALDVLIEADPDLKARIGHLREEVERPGSLTIR